MNQDEIVIWGNGDYLRNTIDKIDPGLNIVALIDRNPKKHGETVMYGNAPIECCDWNEERFKNVRKVIVATRSIDAIDSVKTCIGNDAITVIHISDELIRYKSEWEKQQIYLYDQSPLNVQIDHDEKIVCFVSVTVPIEYCNLQCEYCYVGQHNDFYRKRTILYSPEFIRRAFSINRIGGRALINLCGTGETMLCRGLKEIIEVFLEEGHYVSIITNALIEKPIVELLDNPNANHLFFKCSFHYDELRKRNLLDKYSNCVKSIIASKASCSVELVPHDEIINQIDEIKSYCIKEFGAFPHVTVTRDEEKPGYPIRSSHDIESYRKIWGAFESKLFDIKMRHMKPETGYCIAGKGTILVDLEHGGCRCCPNNMILGNIYRNIDKPIQFRDIAKGCKNSYCINSHAYLSLGMIPELNEISYLDVRDRKTINNTQWIKEPIKSVFMQRICDNLV